MRPTEKWRSALISRVVNDIAPYFETMHSEVINSLLQEREQLASTPNKLGSRFNVSRLEEVNGHIRTFSPHLIEWPERFLKNLLYHASCFNSQEETEEHISQRVEGQQSVFLQILARGN